MNLIQFDGRTVATVAPERLEFLENALGIASRLIAADYVDWQRSGGPSECKHGFAKGIACECCDREAWAEIVPDLDL